MLVRKLLYSQVVTFSYLVYFILFHHISFVWFISSELNRSHMLSLLSKTVTIAPKCCFNLRIGYRVIDSLELNYRSVSIILSVDFSRILKNTRLSCVKCLLNGYRYSTGRRNQLVCQTEGSIKCSPGLCATSKCTGC